MLLWSLCTATLPPITARLPRYFATLGARHALTALSARALAASVWDRAVKISTDLNQDHKPFFFLPLVSAKDQTHSPQSFYFFDRNTAQKFSQ